MAELRGRSSPDRRRWEAEARAALEVGEAELPLLGDPASDPFRRELDARGFPGVPPFTRGIYPTMYRGRLWTFRQYSGFGTATETNRRYRYLLEHGQTGLSVAFDLPTQIGFDSDHSRARGEVGRCGVAITGTHDMQRLFRGIPLDRATVSMTINSTASILTGLLLCVGEASGVPRGQLGGTVQNDILKEYIARGTYIYPPEPSLRLAVDLIEFATREMPKWNTISISGYHMREAGATASQEVAFTLANAIAYVQAVRARGLEVDGFLPRLSFFFSSDRNFLEEIAKFRAARRLWAQIVEQRFASRNPRSQQMRFHTQTAGSSLAAQQPELNVVRTTLEALSSVLGGTQSLHTNALDEALGLPVPESARLALRTQQILAEESGAPSTPDPLAGSYVIEALTDRVEQEAEQYLDRIEAMGGSLAAIEKGFFQSEIAREAYRTARAREAGTEIAVGVNAFTEGNPGFTLFPRKGRRGVRAERITPAQEAEQVRRLRAFRRHRDAARVTTTLGELDRATRAGENVMPSLLAALRARVTLGEIADQWRAAFGEHTASRAF